MKKNISLLLISLLCSFCCFAGQKVTISPTWHQSFEFANMAGQGKWTALGVLLFIGGISLFILGIKKGFWGIKSGVLVNIVFFLLIAAGITCVFSKPAAIRWNNDKVVDKAYLDKVGKQYIWDSLKNNCLIVDGPYNCYSKQGK